MPRLETVESLGGLPSARTGRTIARTDTTAIGESFARMGQAITMAGADIADRWMQTEDTATRAKWVQFKAAEDQRFAESTRNIQPGQARGFNQTYSQGYQERANAFLANVPDRLRGTYQVAALDYGFGKAGDALTFENAELERTARLDIDDTVQQAILPRAQSAAQLAEGDPAKSRLLQEAEADALGLIDSNPALSPVEKDELRRSTRQQIQLAFAGALPETERLRLDPSVGHQTVGDRIVQIESGGDPGADNPNSTALGAGQFTEDTWLGLIQRARPDLVQGKSKSEILALRTDPELSRQMVDVLASENATFLQGRGEEATPGNVYLAHFLGARGAVMMLGAKPETPAHLVNPDAAESNRTVFYNKDGTPKTAGEVVAWATAKMAGAEHVDWSSKLDAIPYDIKVKFGVDAASALVKQQNALAEQAKQERAQQLNELLNGIADGKAGLADIDLAYDGGNGWLADYEDRQRAIKAVEARDKEVLNLAGVTDRFVSGDTFNPFNAEDRKALDLLYDKGLSQAGEGLLDGDPNAVARLNAIVGRTGYVPSSAKDMLQMGMWSADAQTRDRAFLLADNLYRSDHAAFMRAFSEADVKRLQEYQSLSLLPPEARAARLDPNVDMARAKLRADMEAEGRKIAATVDMGAILNDFDPSWFPGDEPNAPLDGLSGMALRSDFDTLFADRFAALGNEQQARTATIELLKQKWGASQSGSASYLMPYPPEHYFPAIDGSHDWMKGQIEAVVKQDYPDAQSWAPVALPFTEGAVGVGQTPTWGVGIIDRDGAYRLLLPAEDTEYAKTHPEDARVQFKPGWPFNYETVHAERTARFRQERTDALTPEPAAQSLRDAIAGYQKAVGAGNTAPPPLEEPPSLIPPLTDEERSQLRPEGLVQ